MDDADRRLLAALQDHARLTNTELAERTGMSTSPSWRRVRRLEQEGVIAGYRAILDRESLGLGVMAFVAVKIDVHDDDAATAFARAVGRVPEVVACYEVSGAADFLLHVVCADLAAFAALSAQVLRRLPNIKETNSSLVMQEIKPFAGLPL